MAKSKCFYCDGLVFEIQTVEILDCAHQHCFIQCTKCGMPVGAVESYNIGQLLSKQSERDAIFRASTHDRLLSIERAFRRIEQALLKRSSLPIDGEAGL